MELEKFNEFYAAAIQRLLRVAGKTDFFNLPQQQPQQQPKPTLPYVPKNKHGKHPTHNTVLDHHLRG